MSTSSGFPLLQLPLLALEPCVNMMNPNTVLELALHSEQCKSRFSIVKYKIDSVEWRMTDDRTGVIIKSNFADWYFSIKTPSEFDNIMRQKGLQVESINLNGTRLSLAKRVESGRIYFWLMDSDDSFESKTDILKNLTNVLMRFVRSSKFQLEYSLVKNVLSKDFFVWKYLNGNPIDLIVFRNRHPLTMTPDDIKFLFENLKFGQLVLDINVSNPFFIYQGCLEAKILLINGGNLRMDLRNMNCQKVLYKNAESIEETLKNWIQGSSMEKLEFLEISHQENINPDGILNGLKHENTRFFHEDISKQTEGFDISNDCVLQDIQRESDGRWGTVCLDFQWRRLYFIVWTPEKLAECCQETRIKLGFE